MSIFDGYATTPVNAGAAKELRGQARPVATLQCPPLCEVPVAEVLRRNPGKSFRDLTGARAGGIEVVGLYQWRGNRLSQWVIRCDCGLHERIAHNVLLHMLERGRHLTCHACMLKGLPIRSGIIAPPQEENPPDGPR